MSKLSCSELVDEYITWLKEQITVSEMDGVCEISTPYLDRHNDYLQFYVLQDKSKFILTDGGYIINDLVMSGVDINTDKRKTILETILRGFGISRNENELKVIATKKDIGEKKHLLIQAMLAVNDMFFISRESIISLFLEEVEKFLIDKNVRYLPSISITGKSGYPHYFDFAIPKSDKAPERFLKAINTPDRNNISSFIFSWNDTRDSREKESLAIAILNDEEKQVSDDSINALSSYNIEPFLWTNREDKAAILAD